MTSRWRNTARTLADGITDNGSGSLARLLERVTHLGRRHKATRVLSGRVLDLFLDRGLLRVDTPVLFILGMHRSGTSWLTGCLEACGLELVNVSRTSRVWNKKGTLEDTRINALNTSMVGPPLTPSRDDRRVREMKSEVWRYAREIRGRSLVGLKDPRFVFTLDTWRSCFSNARCIGVFRNPMAVHESLMTRGEGRVSRERNLNAWKLHNRELLRHHDADPFPLLCFDWEEGRHLKELERACHFLELRFDEQQVRGFYESSLKQQHEFGFLDDSEAKHIYDELSRRSKPLKRAFLGGNPSSGTTVLMRAMQRLGFSQGPEGEGNFEPTVPELLSFKKGNPEHNYRSVAAFTPEQAWAIDKWIRSYGSERNYFLEKSPFHMGKFRAFEQLYGDDAYFIVIQRDPAQTIASCMRRWGHGRSSYSRPIDLMLKAAIDFERHDRAALTNFVYVRYEEFCEQPASVLAKLCRVLHWPATTAAIEAVCNELEVRAPRRHDNIDRLGYAPSTYAYCAELRELWGYR